MSTRYVAAAVVVVFTLAVAGCGDPDRPTGDGDAYQGDGDGDGENGDGDSGDGDNSHTTHAPSECFDDDSDVYDGDALSDVTRTWERHERPDCIRHDGLGGADEYCEAGGSEPNIDTYYWTCHLYDTSVQTPEDEGCLWTTAAEVVGGSCAYELVCVPRDRWVDFEDSWTWDTYQDEENATC